MIGIALMAVLMCVNFTSCSEDDDPTEVKNDNGIVISGKKLAIMAYENQDESVIYKFTYDGEGKLATATKIVDDFHSKYDDRTDYYRFKWRSNNNVEIIGEDQEWDLNLTNGLIKYVENSYGDFYDFNYDKSNRFINATYENRKEFKASWNGDKLMSVEFVDEYIDEFTYGKTCKNGYFPLFGELIDFDYSILFMAHPELVGMRSKQLPVSITTTEHIGDVNTKNIEYEFDKEGYISKIQIGSTKCTLTWE